MGIISLQEAKDFLQITTTATDALIEDYIDMVTAEIEAYCDRSFEAVTYTEVLHTDRSKYDLSTYYPLNTGDYPIAIRLKQYPVQEIISIVDNITTISSSNYTVDNDNGLLRFYEAISDYKEELVATYFAGYDSTTGSTYSMPNDLKLVAKQGVKVYYQNGGQAKQNQGNVKSKSLKDFSVSYGNEQTGLYVNTEMGLQTSYINAYSNILNRYTHIEV